VKGTKTHKQERRERIKESRYNREYERCMIEDILEYLGRKVQEREKWWRDSDVGTRREKTGTGWTERKERWGEKDNLAHVEWMKRNETGEGKERREIRNEDGREIGWMKEIWKRKERIEKERAERLELERFFLIRENTSIGRKERKEGAEWGERETIEHMWNGCSEIREGRERNGEKYWMKTEERDIMDERNMEKEG
jgi:hypothetical protein